AISIYENHTCVYYLLQEVPENEATQRGHVLRFGNSTFAFGNGSLRASLDLDAPGGRLVGDLRISGVPRAPIEGAPMTHDAHEWCPMTGPATGTWHLRAGARLFEGSGSGYLDRNAGLADLESLGVVRWTWARTVLADRLRIAYALFDAEDRCEAAIIDVHEDGRTEAVAAEPVTRPERRNLWGLGWWPVFELRSGKRRMEITVEHRPDDGPFYQRSLVRVSSEVGDGSGFGEVCDSRRIDRGWQRPLVNMCLHRTNGVNSMWLPLFAGPREGRVARLLGVA
ncbi:MAG: hypothetical protein KC912_25505, partial [Proteobacteria bacterium]|nr:hypothetical protein [Pseudomonadota bacterium]